MLSARRSSAGSSGIVFPLGSLEPLRAWRSRTARGCGSVCSAFLEAELEAGVFNPAVDGTGFFSGGHVFAVGLVVEDFAVGAFVGFGELDVASPEGAPAGIFGEDLFEFVVGVEEVELAGAVAEAALDVADEGLEDDGAEGVEEVGEAGVGGEFEGGGFGADNADGAAVAAGKLPAGGILLGDGGEIGVEFDADDFAEGELGGEQEGAAHAGAEVDEGVFAELAGESHGPPGGDEFAEDGGGDAEVGGGVGVVEVAGDEVTAGDEAAGLDVVLDVKRVPQEAVFHGEAGK